MERCNELCFRMKRKLLNKNVLFFFWFFFYVLYSTLLHLPPLRFHCVGGCYHCVWRWFHCVGGYRNKCWSEKVYVTRMEGLKEQCFLSSVWECLRWIGAPLFGSVCQSFSSIWQRELLMGGFHPEPLWHSDFFSASPAGGEYDFSSIVMK